MSEGYGALHMSSARYEFHLVGGDTEIGTIITNALPLTVYKGQENMEFLAQRGLENQINKEGLFLAAKTVSFKALREAYFFRENSALKGEIGGQTSLQSGVTIKVLALSDSFGLTVLGAEVKNENEEANALLLRTVDSKLQTRIDIAETINEIDLTDIDSVDYTE